MKKRMDYEGIMKKYINEVKKLRMDSAPHNGTKSQNEAAHPNNQLFYLTDQRYDNYRFILKETEKIFPDMLKEVIKNLIKYYQVPVEKIAAHTPILSLITMEDNKKILYQFKRYGMPTQTDMSFVQSISLQEGISKIKYVSLVRGNANTYNFSRDDNYDMSLKEFFVLFFNEEEYFAFEEMEKEFTKLAKDCISHTVVKTLSPYAMYSFKRDIVSYIKSKQFNKIINDSITKGNIDRASSKKIHLQFFSKNHYAAIIGDTLFAESFITAEWMYDSLLDANSIDLTVIALGFFKALEQIMYEYIILHSGEDRKIKRIYTPELKGKPEKIFLNNTSITKKQINTMMDSLIAFFEDNKDLFIDDISDKCKEHIISALYEVKNLRNGSFHKNNIEDKKIVEKARTDTYIAIYYILAALKFRDSDKIAFSISLSPTPDIDKLRDYLNYNVHKIYYIGYNGQLEYAAFANSNKGVTYDIKGNAHYTDCFFNAFLSIGLKRSIVPIEDFVKNKIITEERKVDITESDLFIMEGEFKPVKKGMEFSGPLKKIFESGKFLIEESVETEDY